MKIATLFARGFVPIRACSICGEPYGYRVDEAFVAAHFDASCACSDYSNARLATRQEIEQLPEPEPEIDESFRRGVDAALDKAASVAESFGGENAVPWEINNALRYRQENIAGAILELKDRDPTEW